MRIAGISGPILAVGVGGCLMAVGVVLAQQSAPATTATASATAPTVWTPHAADAVVDVWPAGKMPGVATTMPESERPNTSNVKMVTNVSHPTLTLYRADTTDAVRPAMIICPGGAYSILSMDLEGTEPAAWLNSLHITAVVLKYRVPGNRAGAMQDMQRAISFVRAHAEAWKIDPKKLGVMGFSAGGHLAARASTQFEKRTYEAVDEVDKVSCRPDFAVLVYPAYLESGGKLSSDLNIKADIPPTLLVHNEDDKTYGASSKVYDAALTEAKVPHEFLFYQTGGHGYGLRSNKDVKAWPGDAEKWLKKNGLE